MDARLLTIRRATSSDRSSLGCLGAMLVSLHHHFDPDRFIGAGPDMQSRYGDFLVSQLDQPAATILVAEKEGQVVGYTYAAVEGHDWMALRGPAGVLYDLVVHPDFRRDGVGRKLLAATLSALVANGAPRVVLWAADRNVAAQALFASAAFRPTMIEMTWEKHADN